MNPGDEKFERDFEDFLSGKDSRPTAAYRKLPRPEPDPRLDAAVRSMAHRAVNPQLGAVPRAGASRRRVRWLPALGAAAGVVLAAGLTFRLLPLQHGDRSENGSPANDVISVRQLDETAVATTPPLSPALPAATPLATPGAQNRAVPAPAGVAAARVKSEAEALAEATKPAATLQREDAGSLADARQPSGAVGGLAKTARPPEPRAFPDQITSRRTAPEADAVERRQTMAKGAWQNLHDRDAPEDKKAQVQPGTANADNARDLGAATQAAAARKPEPSPATSSTGTAAQAREVPLPAQASSYAAMPPGASTTAPAETSTSAPAAAAPAQSGSPPPLREVPASAVPERRQAADASAPTPQRERELIQHERIRSAESDDALKQKMSDSKDPNAGLYPEHWLANIRVMLREKHRDEALRSLAEFRKRYPDYRLPDDLRDLK